MRNRRFIMGVSFVLTLTACGNSSPLRGEPIPASVQERNAADSGGFDFIVSQASSLVSFTGFKFLGQTETGTEQQPAILNNRFELTGVTTTAGATAESSTLKVFESVGREHHASVLDACCKFDTATYYAFLEHEERPLRTGESLHVPSAISVSDGGRVVFLGPDGQRLTAQLDSYVQWTVGQGRAAESSTGYALLLGLMSADPAERSSSEAMLGRWQNDASSSPAWSDLPADDRPLDPELTPPEVVAGLKSVRVVISSNVKSDEERILRIRTRSGVAFAATYGMETESSALVDPDAPLMISVDVGGRRGKTAAEVIPFGNAPDSSALHVTIDESGIDAEWLTLEEAQKLTPPERAAAHPGGTNAR